MPLKDTWTDAISALKDALKLEAHVTRKLRDIAAACEDPGQEGNNFNDYHVRIIDDNFIQPCILIRSRSS